MLFFVKWHVMAVSSIAMQNVQSSNWNCRQSTASINMKLTLVSATQLEVFGEVPATYHFSIPEAPSWKNPLTKNSNKLVEVGKNPGLLDYSLSMQDFPWNGGSITVLISNPIQPRLLSGLLHPVWDIRRAIRQHQVRWKVRLQENLLWQPGLVTTTIFFWLLSV